MAPAPYRPAARHRLKLLQTLRTPPRKTVNFPRGSTTSAAPPLRSLASPLPGCVTSRGWEGVGAGFWAPSYYVTSASGWVGGACGGERNGARRACLPGWPCYRVSGTETIPEPSGKGMRWAKELMSGRDRSASGGKHGERMEEGGPGRATSSQQTKPTVNHANPLHASLRLQCYFTHILIFEHRSLVSGLPLCSKF